MEEICKTKSENSNILLIEKIKSGDASALDVLINSNMGLVKNISRRFIGRGTDYEDIVQIGTMGMIKAAKSFDTSYGTAFSTYAVPLIIGEIRRFLRDDGIIKVSRDIKKRAIAVLRAKDDFVKTHSREPKMSELCELLGFTSDEITEALDATSPICSLQDKIGDDGMTVESVTPSKDNEIDKATDVIALGEAIRTLDEQSRKIIALRFYKELSQQQTAKILGITQVKVSREEKRIFEKLKGYLAK
ncbi:MAG: sigma-70 family RNA polymerase sigma factor [Clostridiales bacterium]|nr:sigma-70 family RNA polymerase sigma factor [Clostridiales bacterium]